MQMAVELGEGLFGEEVDDGVVEGVDDEAAGCGESVRRTNGLRMDGCQDVRIYPSPRSPASMATSILAEW